MRYLGTLFTGWIVLSHSLVAADWPQWLGPDRNGFSNEKISPWKGDLKVRWRQSVGEGNSSPVVAGGCVVLHAKVKDKDQEVVTAFDVRNGEKKWEQIYDKMKFKPLFGEGPRSTPCIAEGKLYTFGNTGVLAAWDLASGKLLWKRDLLAEYKVPNLFFGISTSPMVIDNQVVVMLGKGLAIAAFDANTGKLTWKVGEDAGSYASPIVVGEGDKRQMIFLTGANVLGVAPKGEIVWKHPFVDRLNESSTTPVKMGDLVIVSSVTAGAIALKLEEGSQPKVSQVWKNPELTCYFSTPVPVGKEHLYLVTGAASLVSPEVKLRCVNAATGKQVWMEPKIGKFHAALLRLADGKLLLHTDTGELKLLAPNTDKLEVLASSKVCGETWAHPALANGFLYVRDGKELICLELPAAP